MPTVTIKSLFAAGSVTPSTLIGNLCYFGNSFTAGALATNPTTDGFAYLGAAAAASLVVATTVRGHAGQTCTQMLAYVQVETDALVLPVLPNVCFFQEWINSCSADGAAVAYRDGVKIIRGRINAGYRVITMTQTHDGTLGGGLNAAIDTLNANLRANLVNDCPGVTLVDVAADPRMANSGANANFSGLHPTTAGHAIIHSIVWPYILTALSLPRVTPQAKLPGISLQSLIYSWLGNGKGAKAGYAGWRDQSTNGIDFSDATGTATSTLNGLECFLTNGTTNEFIQTPVNMQGSKKWTLMIAAQMVSGAATPVLVGIPNGVCELWGSQSGDLKPHFADGAVVLNGGTTWVGAKHVIAITGDSTIAGANVHASLYEDGVLQDSTVVGSGFTPDTNTISIASRVGSLFANALIGEVIIFNDVLGPTDLKLVGTYLSTKWGTPPPP